ncbi:MAG TPA: YlxR family protein [Coriobacteriia bacterium]
MGPRKPPIRTCTGCGATSDKREIVRFVRLPDGSVELDETGKANGRGAYVCAALECFEAAVRKRRLGPALRVNLKEDDTDRLRAELERYLEKRGALVIGDGDA